MDLSQLSDQAWERGRLSVRARLERLHARAWMIGQCAVAAGLAWVIATEVFGHEMAFFAPTAAVIALGTSYGQRLRRVAEVGIGVMVGIGIADLVVVAVAMAAAVLLDAGVILTSQAAVQAIVVTTLLPLSGLMDRVIDALIGCAVALLAASVVPGAPLRRPREEAAKVCAELSRLLREARYAATHADLEHAAETLDRARETEALLNDLRAAASEGLEVVRTTPFHRRRAPQVRSIAEVVTPMDRALRDTRVLIRRIVISARVDETMPPDYLQLLDQLAEAADVIATELGSNRPPDAAQPNLIQIAAATSQASSPLTLSAAVVLGQMRSLTVDLLELSGLTNYEAVALIPERR
jgi:uncharacterized membrane protein YgaE (UPF0421/DUF939 family)